MGFLNINKIDETIARLTEKKKNTNCKYKGEKGSYHYRCYTNQKENKGNLPSCNDEIVFCIWNSLFWTTPSTDDNLKL